MSCRSYQRMLHLNRDGELSPREAGNLLDHLRRCERCALEYRRIHRADEFLDRLADRSPAPADPERLTADILRRVRQQAPIERRPDVLGRLFDFFLIPAVRTASTAVVLILVLTFSAQSLALFMQISNLEMRVDAMSGKKPEAVYVVQSPTLARIAAHEPIRARLTSLPIAMVNGRLLVSAGEAEIVRSAAGLRNLASYVGSSALRLDAQTMEKIMHELSATAQRTFGAR